MAENTKKITKRDEFGMIAEILKAAEGAGIQLDGEFTYEGLVSRINSEIESLDKKAEQAKKRAAEKKTESDALREQVLNCVSTEEAMSIDAILSAVKAVVSPEEAAKITRNKIIARLSQLGEKGTKQVVKEEVTIETGDTKNKVAGYKRVG